jgi:DNA replication licensing factor MCM2
VVYTTGKGASAVGLTAGVHKDPMTREWVLEGGALVLADKGVCLIDEFDKMNDNDRTSIHEAMEQQTISISKAGINTTLKARCSVIAAANPIKGNYNTSLNFNDNVDLTDPILSRFDILSVVKDEPNEELDDMLATFVLNSHMKSHPSSQKDEQAVAFLEQNLLDDTRAKVGEEEGIDQELLKKYIIYARRYVKPRLTEIDREKVTQFYADIRRESNVAGGIPIAVRHIESVLRMSEAFARMQLRDYVRSDDIDMAIEMLLESFLQSQKHSVARQLSKQFEKYKTKSANSNQLLNFELSKLVTEKAQYERYRLGLDETHTEPIEVRIPLGSFKNKASLLNIHNLTDFQTSKLFKEKYTVEGGDIVTTH